MPDVQLFSNAPRTLVFYTCHCYNNDIWDYCSYTQPKYKIDTELPFCKISFLYEAAYERYQQLQYYMDMKKNVAILVKRLRSRDIA